MHRGHRHARTAFAAAHPAPGDPVYRAGMGKRSIVAARRGARAFVLAPLGLSLLSLIAACGSEAQTPTGATEGTGGSGTGGTGGTGPGGSGTGAGMGTTSTGTAGTGGEAGGTTGTTDTSTGTTTT
ncbi:MAG: hypothetical protein R3B70_49075, partial [Polyangiaceae bacterium]